MSFRPSQPVSRPVTISLCLFVLTLAVGLIAAAAHAAEYKMVNCAAISGAPPYTLESNTGIFTFENDCVDQGGDPPGNSSFLRISEHEPGGMAAYGAYQSVNFETPTGINFRSAGGYLREPNAFNSGWQARFGFNYMNGSPQLQLVQGAGLQGAGQGYWGTTSTFASYLWPWPYPIDFYRWAFQLICANPGGCDRTNYNAVDLNGIVFTLRDWEDAKVEWTNAGSDLMSGRWVKGAQNVTWQSSEKGSGLRMERLFVDGAQPWHIDHGPECDTSSDQTNGEYARVFQPCPTGGPFGRSYGLDTAGLSDGAHTLKACAQDFAQWQGLNGTGGESCTERTIRTDNHAPGQPAALAIRTSNPNRYLDHFGAAFSLPPNAGSPIAKVHYDVLDESGRPVMPEKVLTATDPTEVSDIEGPAQPGAYRLKLWLEDEVGFQGPAAEVAIPHDTTPPAAPQGLQVASPDTPRSAEGFDVRWHDIADNGSPVDAAHYQVLDGSGKVVVPTQTVKDEGVEAVEDLETPSQAGTYTLKLWLEDEEGNQGAPVTAPLAYECVRSPIAGGAHLDAGFGGRLAETVPQGQGATLSGALRDASGGPVAGAPVCVSSRVTTDPGREFLGVAYTDAAGNYRFALGAGPSREVEAAYRPGQRRLHAAATLQTVVHPTLRARSTLVRNGEFAHLEGELPGPHNDGVVVVVQVRQGGGWLAFRRYATRGGGHFEASYHFRRTTSPTEYEMRAQVRETTGYPYLQGESDPLRLHVVPGHAKAKPRRCAERRRPSTHGSEVRCARGHRGRRPAREKRSAADRNAR
jgi:hypothetical protein